MNQQHNIGDQFIARSSRKHKQVETVSDVFKVYNSKDELVKIYYSATHEFCGQSVTRSDICQATVAMGKQ